MPKDINALLKLMVEKNASDLHITANWPAHIRIDEKLIAADDRVLSPDEAKDLVYSILNKAQIAKFERDLELDISFEITGISRYRVNVFKQRGTAAASIRLIPYKIWTFEECGLPINVTTSLCKKPRGLVLLTGATGSGKSTSLASMIDWINHDRPCHIITIEDPVEFVHTNKKAIIEQREIYSDTHTFPAALKHVLRQDPDVILIGEMRDLETIESALIIAETGHLVFATLHTSDCVQTINRIVDVFPSHQQQQIRTQLSFVLLGVLSQQLIPREGGRGRVLAVEILLSNPALRSLVRESKIHQVYSVMQTSQKEGMKTMNQALYELYQRKLISYEDAFARTTDPDDLARIFKR
ncbi:MAG: type IV pili twitching motility protein PilT [Omnitrophica bacterium RIFCSPLOWO2_02_FULL_45_16]|nr:MAG: type IV pili twitching motility protein PilT [Omnitrophica bacterium RIFCSPHIGHO2_02_FULL_46_20]OGW94304.1 MAG: type IV pili twitching motility protein PilT [Omnitrophica bacterium RIFCSPLOWO2_12_FULL_45_13]OGW94516.1 MAG: type IV pili twitching motility protein PilT [Omnitrophica bacterium RIFCSPLOWO2_01_FULL_45_24]OGW99994.1 MAG: type IV pili twitching motility protein PilT [Omnitrophica bacterium RIFCSPLOWO2_02_FULL_45_16]